MKRITAMLLFFSVSQICMAYTGTLVGRLASHGVTYDSNSVIVNAGAVYIDWAQPYEADFDNNAVEISSECPSAGYLLPLIYDADSVQGKLFYGLLSSAVVTNQQVLISYREPTNGEPYCVITEVHNFSIDLLSN